METFPSDQGNFQQPVSTLELQAQPFQVPMANPDTVPRGGSMYSAPSTTSFPSLGTSRTSDISYSYMSTDQSGTNSLFDAQSMNSGTSYTTAETEWHVGQEIPCDFLGWSGCDERFTVYRPRAWLDHIESAHLRGKKFPPKVKCWFCDVVFTAKSSSPEDCRRNSSDRLNHISDHIRNENVGEDDILPDWHYAEYLHGKKLITEEVYAQAMEWRDVVRYPDGSLSKVPQMSGIHKPSFTPPSRQAQQERNTQVIVDNDKERRRHRSHRSHRHRHN